MNKQVIFSGIQPSGKLHIGNYIGAIQQWVGLQNGSRLRSNNKSVNLRPSEARGEVIENELIFCVVDLHAISVYQDPKVLREKNLEVAALYMACGIDPKKSHIFIQSENHDHSYLAWIFDCITPVGWMNRMTQFKDKSAKQQESTTIGLFNYPALMAADILLYDTDLVPVGEDQTQHIELARDIAEKFNRLYGETFVLPKPMIDKTSARLMSLQNPMSKMSKSDLDPMGTINLLDTPDEIEKKVKRAVTDSGTEIVYEADKPAIANLLVIYSKLSGREIDSIEGLYRNKSYAEFKKDLVDIIAKALKPIQDRYQEIRRDEKYLNNALTEGLEFTLERSNKKIKTVKEVMGFGR